MTGRQKISDAAGMRAGPTAKPPSNREVALQARWAAGEWRGQTLHATTGEAYQLLYQGRRGGGAGPDFRDAVLLRLGATPCGDASAPRPDRIYGDIELHLRPSGWRAHGHADDPRYNDLALHVVLGAGRTRSGDDDPLAPTRLANGRHAPLVVLQAPKQPQHPSPARPPQASTPTSPAQPSRHSATDALDASSALRWPCAEFATRRSPAERRALLLAAGQARFEQRVARFAAELRSQAAPTTITPIQHNRLRDTPQPPTRKAASPERVNAIGALSNLWPNRRLAVVLPVTPALPVTPDRLVSPGHAPGWSAADHIVWLALAEALGYGRDRAALRAWGVRLAPRRASLADAAAWETEAASHVTLPRVERLRLRGLLAWRERWATSGPWAPIHRAVTSREAIGVAQPSAEQAARRLLAALRVGDGAVSAGRAVILAANVALPFATAWAMRAGDGALATLARRVYTALPGAPSNQITREMASQLGLTRAPDGAAAQQGLHHIWAMRCREKRCGGCPCGDGGAPGGEAPGG